jgi:hypothetical protein
MVMNAYTDNRIIKKRKWTTGTQISAASRWLSAQHSRRVLCSKSKLINILYIILGIAQYSNAGMSTQQDGRRYDANNRDGGHCSGHSKLRATNQTLKSIENLVGHVEKSDSAF